VTAVSESCRRLLGNGSISVYFEAMAEHGLHASLSSALLGCFLFSLTGCGTLVSLSGKQDPPPPRQVYGGVRYNLYEIKHNKEVYPILKVVNVLDIPLSGILDTVLLPATLWTNRASDEKK
jgi:uncharacterized protein YceK